MSEQREMTTLFENLSRLQVSEAVIQDLLGRQPQGVDVRVNADGQPYLGIGGKSVYPEIQTLQTVAREAAALVQDAETDLVVFFGLGLGLHLEFFRKFTNAPIIVFEPDLDVIGAVLGKIPMQLDRVTLVTNTGHLVELVQVILDQAPRGMLAGALPGWVQHKPVAFGQFKDAIQQASRKVELDRKTRVAFSAQWISHMADNLLQYGQMPDLKALGEYFAGKPAILVGAGPSLDGSLESLRKAKGRALICAVHSAAMPLIRAGIYPDLVVIIEGQNLVKYFEGLNDLDRVILVPSVQTHPLHLECGFGSFMGISMEGNVVADWMQKAFGVRPLPSASSVSCVSFSMLHALGCNPLVLVGMDNALTDNRTHARESIQGTMRGVQQLENGRMSFVSGGGETGELNTHEVVAWGGEGSVLARPVYTTYRHWFEGVSQTWASARTLINATEGGARIYGFQELSLDDVINQFCQSELPAESLIRELLDNAVPFDLKALALAVEDELGTIRQAAEVAEKADQKAGKVLGLLASGNFSAVQPSLDGLGELEKRLQEITKKTRLLNTLVGFRAKELSMDQSVPKEKVAATIYSVRQSRKITKLVVEGAEELSARFKPVVESLRDQN